MPSFLSALLIATTVLAAPGVRLQATHRGPEAVLPAPPPARRPPGAVVIPRLTGPITLDGLSDEPAWQAVEPLSAVGHAPVPGAEPSEHTEFRVAHDGQYLYAAGRLYDSEPAAIQATTLRRDEGSFSNDWFAINLDTFYDGETMLTFATNPAGVRTDLVYANDAQSGADFNWNTHWDAAVRQTEHGWFAEIRIPLASLRFRDEDGDVVMGLTVWRRIARRNETITYPAISPRWGWTSPFKASQAQPVVLEGVRSRNPVQLTPYLLAGGGVAYRARTVGVGYERAAQRVGELGLDLKYGLTSRLTLDLTVNPDFAQVEADDVQLNLSRSSLFVPEKRLFFQERAEVFGFTLGRSDRLFHSRRIGLADGVPVPLQGGARLVGRARNWDLGALAMSAGSGDHGPAEGFGVFRARRQVLNAGSYLGMIATLHAGETPRTALGADGRARVRGQDFVAFQVAQTSATSAAAAAPAERSFARLFWERRGREGVTYSLDAARAGPAFEPSLGFLSRRDYSKLAGHVAYGWRPGPASALLRHEAGLGHLAFWSASRGALESRRVTADWRFETKSGRQWVAGVQTEQERLADGLGLAPGVEVPAGGYHFRNGFVSYASPGGSSRRIAVNLDGGGFFDGWQATARVTPVWNVSRHLELSGMAQLSHVAMPVRDQRVSARIARLRARAMLNTRLSAEAFAQYSSLRDELGMNLRLRYNPREGDDLFLVYNAGLNTERPELNPLRPRLDQQSLLVKYSRTVSLGG